MSSIGYSLEWWWQQCKCVVYMPIEEKNYSYHRSCGISLSIWWGGGESMSL
jgi:hypothetical protein